MKTKVDPLVKLLTHKQNEASRALAEAIQRSRRMEEEREQLETELEEVSKRFDQLQSSMTGPEEHELHQRWMARLTEMLEAKKRELEKQRLEVERCRAVLTELHRELKTLEKYKENLAERYLEEKKALEAKELDEIAGQKHRRRPTEGIA